MPGPETIVVVDPQGNPRELSYDQAASALEQPGWRVQTDSDRRERLAGEAREDTYGGTSGKIAAGAAGVARGVTLGLSDVAIDQLGGSEDLRGLRDTNPISSTVGEVAGAVATSFAAPGSMLARTPAGLAARAGSAIARSAEGAGVVARIGRIAAGGAFEGGAQGLGTGISEIALSEDPLTTEVALSTLRSNFLTGASIGAGAGLAATGLEKGLTKAKGLLDHVATRGVDSAGELADDLAGLGSKELRAAELAEREALVTAQAARRASTVDDLTAYRQTVKEANPWLVITDGEPSSLLSSSNKALRNAMNDPVGLAKNPASALKSLRVQEQALMRAVDDAEAIAARLTAGNKKLARDLGEELATLPDHIDSVELTGKAARRYGSFADVKVPKGGSVNVPRAKVGEFLDAIDSGAVQGSEAAAFKKLPDLLEANRSLQQKIEGASIPKAELTSSRLSEIADARDALTVGAKKGIGEQMLGGAAYSGAAGVAGMIPGIGPLIAPFVGAKAAGLVGEQVFGRLATASKEAARRTSAAVGAFLDVTGKVLPVAPVLASKVLTSVAYAPPRAPADTASSSSTRTKATKKPTLADLYRLRSEEIRSQVSHSSGGAVMNSGARRAMADRLDPIRAHHPVLADRIETLAVRRLEFLASKLPRRPDLGGIATGPDLWQPSEMEMRTWARYAAAVEDPGGIEERLADGSVSPEDAEVMREVYPERLAELKRQILGELPALQKRLPYHRRLALTILTGIPVDPSMDPRVLSQLQASFTEEPGSEGGTQAPRAMPQFGSVKVEEPTPAQDRAG